MTQRNKQYPSQRNFPYYIKNLWFFHNKGNAFQKEDDEAEKVYNRKKKKRDT